MWGTFGQAETPEAMWGPRDVAVDDQGRVFVTDTGNKRVVIFDADGNYLAQFGTAGMLPGEFDEPVGIAIDKSGRLFVADTWNQRVQVFEETSENVFTPASAWEIAAWYGQSLDNKPYLSVDEDGQVFIVDPEGYRVLWFSNSGEIVGYWGDYSAGIDGFGLVGSVAADPAGGVWVTDAGNSRILHFMLPGKDQQQ
jgi:DNA-binding beta-propeller fold protein YncE